MNQRNDAEVQGLMRHVFGDKAVQTTAPDLLIQAADTITERATLRDQPDGERSMERAAEMFAVWKEGQPLARFSEHDGWIFMALLKLARAAGGRHHADDYVDGAAYIALAGECQAKQ